MSATRARQLAALARDQSTTEHERAAAAKALARMLAKDPDLLSQPPEPPETDGAGFWSSYPYRTANVNRAWDAVREEFRRQTQKTDWDRHNADIAARRAREDADAKEEALDREAWAARKRQTQASANPGLRYATVEEIEEIWGKR